MGLKKILLLVCFLSLVPGLSACTCFAVYTNQPIYGMNFDYPPVDIRFTLTPAGGMRVFQMEFLLQGRYASTVGMNSRGLFGSCQMRYPIGTPAAAGDDEIYTWQLFDHALHHFTSLDQVTALLSQKRLVHSRTSLHDCFADPIDALVVEPGTEGNAITRKQGDYLVMTNFPLKDFSGKNPDQMTGVGADRYRAACRHIEVHLKDFTVDQAFTTLEKAQSKGRWPTLASMVFLPYQGIVYIALNSDFSHIWRVSLPDGILATHAGFSLQREMPLDASGIRAACLAAMNSRNNPADK